MAATAEDLQVSEAVLKRRHAMAERLEIESVRIDAARPVKTPPAAANDNAPDGRHEWPAYDRLKAGRLMRSADDNHRALIALVRLRRDLDALVGRETWTPTSDSAAVSEDVEGGFSTDLVREKVTAEHLVGLHMAGVLEYRRAPDGQVLPFKSDDGKFYQLEDRLRGPRGPSQWEHPAEVEQDLNARYSEGVWPKAPNAAKSARQLFVGAQIKTPSEPRAWKSQETALVNAVYAEKTCSHLESTLPSNLWEVLDLTVNGATAETIGGGRGHNGKYAQTVGAELQRIALEALVEAYQKYDARGDDT